MHEIINISVSHRANHLTTQFYNNREKLLYTDNRPNDSAIFLNPIQDKISKTVSYFPRALLWDAKLGNGSLGTYQYSETNDYYDPTSNTDSDSDSNLMVTHPRIEKSEYQKALDAGKAVPSLNENNSKYWSDYSRLIYAPKSFNNLNNWYHDEENPNLPDFEKLNQQKFESYAIGVEEFTNNYVNDFFDLNLHFQLEQCDSLQGFNLITDVDNAWGGFSSSLVLELKNELPKNSIFTWTFNEDDALNGKTKRDRAITRSSLSKIKQKLKASVNLQAESDLFIPLYSNPELVNWQLASDLAKVFDTVNSTFDQKDTQKRKTMDYIVNCISDGDNNKNIVSDISDLSNSNAQYSYFPLVNPIGKHQKNNYHEFSSCKIIRGDEDKTLYSQDEKKVLDHHDKSLFKTVKTYQYYPSDTINEKNMANNFDLTLATTENCRNVYRQWNDIVTKYFRDDNDREQLKEDISTVASAYEYGWYDDDDSGDDGY